jgi:hypothetical protein
MARNNAGNGREAASLVHATVERFQKGEIEVG